MAGKQVKAGWRSRIVGQGEEAPDQLLANPMNFRVHPKGQQEALEGALNDLGWIQQVIVNRQTGHVIDGHLRITLAMRRGEPAVPVVYVDLSPAEEAEALVTLDPIAAMAATDAEKLDALLREVQSGEAGVQAMLADLAKQNGLYQDKGKAEDAGAQVDKAAELGEKWATQSGQLWEIPSATAPGKSHRLLIGDCRNPDDVRRLCPAKVQGVFTSPPYAEQRKEQYGGVPADRYVEWWEAVQANVRDVMLPDGSFFVNIKPHCEDGERHLYVLDLVAAMRRRYGWRYVDEFAWVRNSVPGGWDNRFKNAWEPVHQFALTDSIKFRPDAVAIPTDAAFKYSPDNPKSKTGFFSNRGRPDLGQKGLARPDNVLRIGAENRLTEVHSAPFPVPLAAFFILAYSDPGDTWLDPFMGSGTVFVAAEQNGRLACGTEVLPKYAGVILERLVGLGLTPVLAHV